MIPVMVINNNSLVDGLPEIDFVQTYQYRRNGIHASSVIVKSEEYEYISHDDIGLFTWNYLDILLRRKPELEFMFKEPIKHYSTSIGPACVYCDIVNGIYENQSPVEDVDELLWLAKTRIDILKRVFPNVKLSFENTAYRNKEAYDNITKPKFISELVTGSHVGFTLDIAHALITTRSKQESIYNYLYDLPLENITEIHISSPFGVHDSHELPDKEVISLLEWVLCYSKEDVYVVVEYYKDMNKLKDFYENVLVRYL